MRMKTAVIGCGAITRGFHIPSLLHNPAFELAALVDPDVDAAKRIASEYGLSVPVLNDVRDLPLMDAAIVAVPPHLHAEICIGLLHKGVHVLCEKPMAATVAEGEAMMKAAHEGKSILLIGMQKHYCPNTGLLKDILTDGMLGQLQGITLVSAIRSQWDAANVHRFNPEYTKGGILFEHGVHWIYRWIYWFGRPKLIRYADDRIDGLEVNARIENLNHAYGYEFSGSMYFSWDHNLKNMITVVGDGGTADVMESDDASVFVARKINDKPRVMVIRNEMKKGEADLFNLQLEYFAQCIDGNLHDPEPTRFALESLVFIEECYLSRVGIDQPWVFSGIEKKR